NGEKVCAILPVNSLTINEPEISFVNQCRRLHGVAGPLAAHVTMRKSAQFLMNQRHQLIESRFIAATPRGEEFSHFVRRAHLNYLANPVGANSITFCTPPSDRSKKVPLA